MTGQRGGFIATDLTVSQLEALSSGFLRVGIRTNGKYCIVLGNHEFYRMMREQIRTDAV
ncbi:hypothetical protein DSECCO2_317590 [anaerobic digester metagenome]